MFVDYRLWITEVVIDKQLLALNIKGSRKKVYVSRLNFERFWRLLCYLYRISVAFLVKYNI